MLDSLALIRTQLAPELVSERAGAALALAAAALAPVHRGGFECRLAAGEGDVDLQQGVSTDHGEMGVLGRFLASRAPASDAWGLVGSLCAACDHGGPLHDAVAELWLELDQPTSPSGGPMAAADAPSVFAVLRPMDGHRSRRAAEDVLRLLIAGDQCDPLVAVLDRCARACSGGARVSHLGVMLGRSPASMRIHVERLALRDFERYLETVGWPGDIPQARASARLLLDHTDSLIVCLDVAGDLLPRIGLECFLSQRHGLDPRWRALLRHLVEIGTCDPEKAEAMLRWPGATTPVSTMERWPEELVVAALTRPESSFGVLERRLSHVKLTCEPGGPVGAKGYFGYGPVWISAATDGEDHSSDRPAPAAVAAASSCEEAIERAVAFLTSRRNQAGWWRDFFDRARPAGAQRRVMAYASDEWVTAYVACALAPASAVGREAACEALELLLGRRGPEEGWGYHALLPVDADSTTWVLRLAAQLGAPLKGRLAAARDVVMRLTGSAGDVATYPAWAADELADFLGISGSYAGWCAGHTCVTAAAAALELDPRHAEHLRAAQNADGSWSAHWWEDPEYATARAVEALHAAGDQVRVGRALSWCVARIDLDHGAAVDGRDGRLSASAFATALALQALVAGHSADGHGIDVRAVLGASRQAARWLSSRQLGDGSWSPSARLRVPPPWAVNPLSDPEDTLTYVDDDALFTTATVLASLVAYRDSVFPRGR